jgi:hypothetical protein
MMVVLAAFAAAPAGAIGVVPTVSMPIETDRTWIDPVTSLNLVTLGPTESGVPRWVANPNLDLVFLQGSDDYLASTRYLIINPTTLTRKVFGERVEPIEYTVALKPANGPATILGKYRDIFRLNTEVLLPGTYELIFASTHRVSREVTSFPARLLHQPACKIYTRKMPLILMAILSRRKLPCNLLSITWMISSFL